MERHDGHCRVEAESKQVQGPDSDCCLFGRVPVPVRVFRHKKLNVRCSNAVLYVLRTIEESSPYFGFHLNDIDKAIYLWFIGARAMDRAISQAQCGANEDGNGTTWRWSSSCTPLQKRGICCSNRERISTAAMQDSEKREPRYRTLLEKTFLAAARTDRTCCASFSTAYC